MEARKAKQLTKDQAYDLLQDLNMFGGLANTWLVGGIMLMDTSVGVVWLAS